MPCAHLIYFCLLAAPVDGDVPFAPDTGRLPVAGFFGATGSLLLGGVAAERLGLLILLPGEEGDRALALAALLGLRVDTDTSSSAICSRRCLVSASSF